MKQMSYFLLTMLCFSTLEAPKKREVRSRKQRINETIDSEDETFKDAKTQKQPRRSLSFRNAVLGHSSKSRVAQMRPPTPTTDTGTMTIGKALVLFDEEQDIPEVLTCEFPKDVDPWGTGWLKLRRGTHKKSMLQCCEEGTLLGHAKQDPVTMTSWMNRACEQSLSESQASQLENTNKRRQAFQTTFNEQLKVTGEEFTLLAHIARVQQQLKDRHPENTFGVNDGTIAKFARQAYRRGLGLQKEFTQYAENLQLELAALQQVVDAAKGIHPHPETLEKFQMGKPTLASVRRLSIEAINHTQQKKSDQTAAIATLKQFAHNRRINRFFDVMQKHGNNKIFAVREEKAQKKALEDDVSDPQEKEF